MQDFMFSRILNQMRVSIFFKERERNIKYKKMFIDSNLQLHQLQDSYTFLDCTLSEGTKEIDHRSARNYYYGLLIC